MDALIEIQKLMQAGKFETALSEAQKITQRAEADSISENKMAADNSISQKYIEGLYLQAVCARYLKKYKLASSSLDRLRKEHKRSKPRAKPID